MVVIIFRYLRQETSLNDEVECGIGYDVPVVSMYKFEGVDDELVEHSPKRSSTIPYFPFKTNENDWLKMGKSEDQQKSSFNDWKSVQDYRYWEIPYIFYRKLSNENNLI